MDSISPIEENNFKKFFTEVTPLSKFLALALFVALPILGFLVGYNYGSQTKEFLISNPDNTVTVFNNGSFKDESKTGVGVVTNVDTMNSTSTPEVDSFNHLIRVFTHRDIDSNSFVIDIHKGPRATNCDIVYCSVNSQVLYKFKDASDGEFVVTTSSSAILYEKMNKEVLGTSTLIQSVDKKVSVLLEREEPSNGIYNIYKIFSDSVNNNRYFLNSINLGSGEWSYLRPLLIDKDNQYIYFSVNANGLGGFYLSDVRSTVKIIRVDLSNGAISDVLVRASDERRFTEPTLSNDGTFLSYILGSAELSDKDIPLTLIITDLKTNEESSYSLVEEDLPKFRTANDIFFSPDNAKVLVNKLYLDDTRSRLMILDRSTGELNAVSDSVGDLPIIGDYTDILLAGWIDSKNFLLYRKSSNSMLVVDAETHKVVQEVNIN